MKARIQVLKCDACGSLAVSINDHRITSHKCGGGWTVALEEEFEAKDLVGAGIFAVAFSQGEYAPTNVTSVKAVAGSYAQLMVERFEGSKTKLSRVLGVHRRTIYRWADRMKELAE